jgi:hypothetical protein
MSMRLKHIIIIQQDILHNIDNKALTYNKYMVLKEHMNTIQNGIYYSLLFITVTAGLNLLVFIAQMVYICNVTRQRDESYTNALDLIAFYNFQTMPYLLKGIY